MFKGFTKELQQALTHYNKKSKKNFIFCVCDLNYSSDRQEEEYKYDIVDEELQKELGKIITAGGGTLSNPKGINFSNRWEKFPSGCYNLKYGGIKNYNY